MQNKKVYFYGILFSLIFSANNSVYAQTTDAQSPTDKGKMIVLADINFREPKIIFQEGGNLQVYFRLENKLAQSEAGIRYGVQLARDRELLDEKVFTDDILSIDGNSEIKKVFEYLAPNYLAGSFDLWLVAKSESGLPLATFKFEEPVTLKGGGEYLEIDSKSCQLKIDGEAGDKKYTLTQGVSLKANESLKLSCDMASRFKTPKTISPSSTIFYRSSFGDQVGEVKKGDEISFNPGEKKKVELKIEKPQIPQAYETRIDFFDGQMAISTPLYIHYVIAGETATIQKVDLDKAAYRKGEAIEAKLFWVGSADNFDGSRTGKSENAKVVLDLEVFGPDNQKCSDALGETLDSQSKEVKLSLTAKKDCVNPRVKVVLKNGQGQVLAENEFSYQKQEKDKWNPAGLKKATS